VHVSTWCQGLRYPVVIHCILHSTLHTAALCSATAYDTTPGLLQTQGTLKQHIATAVMMPQYQRCNRQQHCIQIRYVRNKEQHCFKCYSSACSMHDKYMSSLTVTRANDHQTYCYIIPRINYVNVNVNMRFIVPPLLKEHRCIT